MLTLTLKRVGKVSMDLRRLRALRRLISYSPDYGNAKKSMHAGSIINEELIALNPGDTLEKALRAMDELKVEHLPVAAEGKYLGLVAEQHLLDQ